MDTEQKARLGEKHDADPFEELKARQRYLAERKSEVFELPGYLGKAGVRLRVLDRAELKEISQEAMELRRQGREDWDLVDNMDTLLRATECIVWRKSRDSPWKPLHEYPNSPTSSPIGWDAHLADVLDLTDQLERGEGAEAESRQLLRLVFADDMRVSLTHDDYMAWRTFADEEAGDEVADELKAEVDQEAEPGEAVGAT